jgi:hypothetical protein
MSKDLYYTAPSDDIFQEIQKAAIKIWRTYDDTHGYATEKIDTVKGLENVRDNWMYIVAMFDASNQVKLLTSVRRKTAQLIMEAIG